MTDILQALVSGMTTMSVWEFVGVVLGFAYLILAIRQNIWCWVVAGASELIFVSVMFNAQLYMESALRIFYFLMAIYGWYSWRYLPHRELPVISWPLQNHLIAAVVISVLVFVSGALLTAYTDAALPYWDSFTTWAAMFATWLIARKVLENWHYWFVIDAVSVWLYFERGLVFASVIYAVYLVMIFFGYQQWKRSMCNKALRDAEPVVR